MAKPKVWTDPEKLVTDLKECDWRDRFDRGRQREAGSDARTVIQHSVAANTFRAFRGLPNKPSVVFRQWAFDALFGTTTFFERLLAVTTTSQYDSWLMELADHFRRSWRDAMGRDVPFGPSLKLPNLLVKSLCLLRDMPRPAVDRIIWFLHVPLDSYTIQAVRGSIVVFPDSAQIGRIPPSAGMGWITNMRMYQAFQAGIGVLATRSGVPRIALDCLAWDAGHA